MIEWDESLSTGVENIDAQHKMLVEKLNEFSQVMTNAQARETAGEVIDFIRFYAAWHFEREEDCMNEYQCPVAAQNKQAHKEFLATFDEFYEQWQVEGMDAELVESTYQELANWVEMHIRHIDTHLRKCVHN